MPDARRGLGAVGDGDHRRRRREPQRRPLPGGLAPVVPQEVVAVQHQVRQRVGRRGPAVQVVPYLRVVVDVVEAGAVGPRVGRRIVAHHHARRLDQTGLDGVVQSEVAHDPVEQRLLGAAPAGRHERRGGEVVAAQDAARAVDAVEAADPLGGGLQVGLGDAPGRGLFGDAPGVVRFVVDDQQVARRGEVAEYRADVGFIAHRAALVDAAPPRDLRLGLPVERVPVADHDPAQAQLVEQRGRDDAELPVVVVGVRRIEDRQPALDGEAGGDHQDVAGEPAVLRIGGLVQHLPGDHHRHDHGLAGAGRHLGAQPRECSAVAGNVDAHPVGGRRLAQPHQGLHRLELAEEEPARIELLRVGPVREQPPGHGGGAGVAGGPPRLDARADGVDQRNLDRDARIVERPRVGRSDDVSRRPAARRQVEQPRRPVVPPVPRRLLIRRVDRQPVDGGLRHYSGSLLIDGLCRFQYRPAAQVIAAALDAAAADEIDVPSE